MLPDTFTHGTVGPPFKKPCENWTNVPRIALGCTGRSEEENGLLGWWGYLFLGTPQNGCFPFGFPKKHKTLVPRERQTVKGHKNLGRSARTFAHAGLLQSARIQLVLVPRCRRSSYRRIYGHGSESCAASEHPNTH